MNQARPTLEARRRRAQLAAIHVAKAQLLMAEDAYRALVERVSTECGRAVTSSAHLDEAGRQKLLDELRRLGAAAPARKGRQAKPSVYPGKPHNFNSMPEMITKIEAQLADMKLGWAYADAIAKRMHGVAKVAWCRKEAQLRDIIAALHVEQTKRDCGSYIDRALAALGVTEADLVAPAGPFARLPDNWRRQVNALKTLCKFLEAKAAAAGVEVGPA
jgi:phage gp16-like protein